MTQIFCARFQYLVAFFKIFFAKFTLKSNKKEEKSHSIALASIQIDKTVHRHDWEGYFAVDSLLKRKL